MVFLAGLLTRVLTGVLTVLRAGVRTGGLAFLAEPLGALLLFACPLALAAGALDGGGTWAVTGAITLAVTLAVTGAANGFGFGFFSLRATTLAAGASVAAVAESCRGAVSFFMVFPTLNWETSTDLEDFGWNGPSCYWVCQSVWPRHKLG